MRRFARVLWKAAFVAFAALIAFVSLWRAHSLMLLVNVSDTSKVAILAALVGGLLASLMYPLVSKWTDIRNSPEMRHPPVKPAASVAKRAVAAGVATSVAGVLLVACALPSPSSAATSSLPGGIILRVSSGTRGCSYQLTLSESFHKSLCACYLGTCLKGISPKIAVGQRVRIEVSANWAGTVVVGLVQDGA
jgi:hypothetical protein